LEDKGVGGQRCWRTKVLEDKGVGCIGLKTEAAEKTMAPGDDSAGAASKYRPVHTKTSPV
jgi:hypothetical protein